MASLSSRSARATNTPSTAPTEQTAQTMPPRWRRAATLAELEPTGVKTIALDGRTLVLWRSDGQVYALDTPSPHAGFPPAPAPAAGRLPPCHWHSARFDLRTGGTFDQFADDVQAFPVELRGDEIWVDTTPQRDTRNYYRTRLRDGLEQ